MSTHSIKKYAVVNMFLLFICLSTSLLAQTAKETRDVKGFTGIRVGGALEVELRQGDYEIIVEGPEEMLQYVETKNILGKLKVEMNYDKKWKKNQEKIKVYITAPAIEFIDASGACDFATKAVMKVPNMAIEISGASNSQFILDVASLKVNASGASNTKITGFAVKQDLELSGASSYNARQLSSEEIDIDASGASKIEITAHEKIFGDLSGASECIYYGKPKSVDVTTSGASSLQQRD
jgi:hypothetical protein